MFFSEDNSRLSPKVHSSDNQAITYEGTRETGIVETAGSGS